MNLVSPGSACCSSGCGRLSDDSSEESKGNAGFVLFFNLLISVKLKSCCCNLCFFFVFVFFWKAPSSPVRRPESLWLRRSAHSGSLPSSSWRGDHKDLVQLPKRKIEHWTMFPAAATLFLFSFWHLNQPEPPTPSLVRSLILNLPTNGAPAAPLLLVCGKWFATKFF